MNLKPIYPHRPIQSLDSLARHLGITRDELLEQAPRTSSAYRSFPHTNGKGKTRIVSDAFPALKKILTRIQNRILTRVIYPHYLHGSLSGRSPATNAAIHLNAKTLVAVDVKGFFDNARSEDVFEIWHGFLRFHPSVARLLTDLTTKDGHLPQGAPTSPCLANLLFWREEWKLAYSLARRGYTYTRYVDDIAVSSQCRLIQEDIDSTVGAIRSLVNCYALRLNNRKTQVTFAGRRMEVNGLDVGSKAPALRRTTRENIRAAVHAEKAAWSAEIAAGVKSKRDSSERLRGRLSHLGQFHPREAGHHRETLRMGCAFERSPRPSAPNAAAS